MYAHPRVGPELDGADVQHLSLSLYNLKPRGIEVPNAIVALALVYGGLTQWVAGVFEFVCGNTFG